MVDLPAEEMELLWGRCHLSGGCGEALVELVAWGSPQLGILQLGHQEEGGR